MVVVTVVVVPSQTVHKKGPSELEQTLTQFLCQYFSEEQPSSDLLKWIDLKG